MLRIELDDPLMKTSPTIICLGARLGSAANNGWGDYSVSPPLRIVGRLPPELLCLAWLIDFEKRELAVVVPIE